MMHLSSCFFYLTARMDDYNEDTWVTRLFLKDKSYATKYIAAYYWSI